MNLRVNVDVPDLDRGIAFYRTLGLTPGRRLGDDWVELTGAPIPIDLLRKKPGTTPAPGAANRAYERHWTPVHLDFAVSDLELSVGRAIAAGAKLEQEIVERKWGRMAILSDPFGHGLCLLQFKGRGYDELFD